MDFNTPTAPHKVGENSAMTGTSVVTLAPGAIAPEIIRPSDRPDVSEPRKRLVSLWLRRVRGAAGKYAPRFKKMLEDTKFARGKQWENEGGIEGNKYVANITQRHIQQRVASLYAKNPTIIADRRKTLDFKIWDETPEMLKGAMAQAQQQIPLTGVIPQNVAELIADVTQGLTKRRMLDRVADTAQIAANYFIDQQQPPFKKQMKQMVRRVCTTGVGYVKMGYRRAMELRPDDVATVTDITSKIVMMEREMYDLSGDEKDAKEYEIELLREQVATLQGQMEVIEEGPTFDFPKSDSIIPDPNCIALDGFVGAAWVAQRFILTPDQIKEVYKVDIGNRFIACVPDSEKGSATLPNTADQQGTAKVSFAKVYEIFSKNDKMVFVVCEGYDDFLKEPGPPDIILKRFWTIFPILFNESETDEDIFPQSDVQLIRPMQVEYNRSREGLREHRHANRPKTIIAKGLLDDDDKEKMRDHPANALIELNALNPNQKIDDVFQAFKGPPIDPALYDNSPFFDDLQIVGGESESNLGGSAPASTTATATTVAETSRTTSLASNADDLDDLLSDLAGCLGEVMFAEMSAETAIKIAGNGAAWPQLNQQQIADSLYLDIEAGSSGRPNKAVEAANFDKVMPILMQIPGISADWLAKQAVKRLDDRLDPTDALQAGIQSMMAANAQASAPPPPQPGSPEPKPGEGQAPQQPAQPGADLRNLPALQGMHGANNAQPPPTQPPPGGGSPMLPAPAH